MNPQPQLESLQEYSAASTIITFDEPIPLFRGPLKSSDGTYNLAFRNQHSLSNAFEETHSKLVHQCEEGARIGCAVSASRKCQTPWWRNLIGGGPNLKEREECEVREMEVCFVDAEHKCEGFANDKCRAAFRKARVAHN